MKTSAELQQILDGASIADDVLALRPDYRALLIAVDGLEPGDSDEHSEALVARAEASAQAALAETAVEDLPHIAAWREAYRAFGAKPQRTRNSAEALLRRAAVAGLPRVNHLTEVYNAISVLHQTPLGGESLDAYVGAPRLIRATGSEPFDTSSDGTDAVEHPDAGEVVWCDDEGVTCRRWNWRQGRRTQLHPTTRSALFIIDALEPVSDNDLQTIGDDLVGALRATSPNLVSVTRVLPQPTAA